MSDVGDDAPPSPRVIARDDAVLAEVGKVILRGAPRPGSPVPTEDEIAAELRISRRSARRALAALDSAGVVAAEWSPADGPALADTDIGAFGRLLRLTLRVGSPIDTDDLLGVRTAVERSAAARAAQTATEIDLAALRVLVDRMRAPGIDPNAFGVLDTAFHLRIAAVAGGGLQMPILEGMSDAIGDQMLHALATAPDWHATARRLADEHERLLTIISGGRDTEAADFVEAHVHNFYAAR